MASPSWRGLLLLSFCALHSSKGQIAPTGPPLKMGKNLAKNQTNVANSLSELSACQKGCSSGLADSLGLVMSSINHTQRYKDICRNYKESVVCIEEEIRCGHEDHSMFETMTSGIHYMCVENQQAFVKTIGCIDDQSGVVQTRCEVKCKTKTRIMELIMRGPFVKKIQEDFQNQLMGRPAAEVPGIEMLTSIDPNMLGELNYMSTEMCGVGECVLGCIRDEFSEVCPDSTGFLLTEVIVRPIAAIQAKMNLFGPILGMFLPPQCAYLTRESELQQFRYDPSMDKKTAVKTLARNQTKVETSTTTQKPVQQSVKKPAVKTGLSILPNPGSPLARSANINALPKQISSSDLLTETGKIFAPQDVKTPFSGAVKPTTASAQVRATSAPVSPSSGGAKPTPASVPSGQSSSGPVKPTSSPVRPTPGPVSPKSSSSRPLRHERPASTPAASSPGPVKPTVAPSSPPKSSPRPEQPTTGPVRPTPPSSTAKNPRNATPSGKITPTTDVPLCDS